MSSDQPQATAIEQLQALGLSAYAARTFVALVRLGDATAQDVSGASDVPRTRVYDAVEELTQHGLVDVQQSNPKRFCPVSSETAGRHFDREYNHRVQSLTEALDTIEPARRTTEQRGVWTVSGREAVSDRLVDFIEMAEDEIVFMSVEDLLNGAVVESLRAASNRGVTIRFAEMSQSATERLHEDLPDARPFESLWDWSDTPTGRLLMVDETATLVSVLVSGTDGEPDETAIWGKGSSNGLVVVLKSMFTWQLDGNRD